MKIKGMNTGFQFTIQPGKQEANVQIKVLQKQKAELQERLTEIKDNKEMDPKRKLEHSQLIKEQLEELDQQIQKVKFRQLKDRINLDNDDNKKKKSEEIENKPNRDAVHQMSSLIAASQTFEQVRTLDKVKSALKGRLKTLQVQVQSNGDKSSYKQQEMEEINKRIQSVNQSMMKKLSEAYEKTREVNRRDVYKPIDPKQKEEKELNQKTAIDSMHSLSPHKAE
ncbi:MAG: FlxA-like family protein [Bacillaceae bacterium]|nr:FlxA-like family protein [Bacillaceae bacterium]